MLAREAWKYVEIKKRLSGAGIEHSFEEKLPGGMWFYDLLLPDMRVAVEFDGPYHDKPWQRPRDVLKDRHAEECGWRVVRIHTDQGCVIPSDVLDVVLV